MAKSEIGDDKLNQYMWNLDQKRGLPFGPDVLMFNSSLAFPRIPPTVGNSPVGISESSKLKESIINDNSSLISKLTGFQSMFQNYASGLFNFGPLLRFGPGHPMNSINVIEHLKLENDQLKKENIALKRDLDKPKKI